MGARIVFSRCAGEDASVASEFLLPNCNNHFRLRLPDLCCSFDDQQAQSFAALGEMGKELFAHARVPEIVEVRGGRFQGSR